MILLYLSFTVDTTQKNIKSVRNVGASYIDVLFKKAAKRKRDINNNMTICIDSREIEKK